MLSEIASAELKHGVDKRLLLLSGDYLKAKETTCHGITEQGTAKTD
jgi:hypothetical protein